MGEEQAASASADTIQVHGGSEVDSSPPRGHPFPIVGVGASAGGLDALKRLLEALPDKIGMAFVLVQHLDPHHESQLPEILASSTTMPVHAVEDGMKVRPNEVFVIPPNSTMVLEDGVLRLAQRKPGLHLPIDAFFESLARLQGGRAIGIVLSGNASDGSHGVRAIKEECGLTFAQDEASAQHVGMPRNAIATGSIDYVLSPAEIAKELTHLSQHPFVRLPDSAQDSKEVLPDGDGELKKIFNALRIRTQVDFGHYKQNTIRRRIGRRMIVKRARTMAAYSRLLDQQPEEIQELYRDLLINVTNFFRDPEVFNELARLLKDLLAARNSGEPFRVWVPGCSTGEEAYSLAICLKELIDDLQLDTPIQIFGTDISDMSLDRARAGIYPDSIAQDVSAERLRRFFLRVDRGYQVTKAIREGCVFARQDVTNDPPFGRTDIISCRNLLIYLDSTLQRKVLPVFHYSLNPTGLLLLGSAESIAAASDLFTVVDKQHHIYGRKATPLRLTLELAGNRTAQTDVAPAKVRTTLSGVDLQRKIDLVIQSKYAPSAVVVDADLQILHFRGHTSFYLEASPGEPNLNLLRMARGTLAVPLRRAIEAASTRNVSIRETAIAVEYRGEGREVTVEITPIAGASPGERYFLVVFEEAQANLAPPLPAPGSVPAGKQSDYLATLEVQARDAQQQLAEAREYLRNANEDHEASSEELRAANEEVRSANEELQSTNEELSTTKEELQSANEELTTLNEELQNRNYDLDALNNDLLNLLSAVDIAFVMVDNQFRLRRFSTAAEKALNVGAIDIGYPITNISGPLDLTAFDQPMRKVIETLSVERWDIQDKEGRWFSATIRPYRTTDNRIAGAVVVFVDIDPLKRSLRAAEHARDYAEGMIETVREPLLVIDGDLRIQRATSAFYNTFRVSRGDTEGRLLYDLGNGQWNVPRLRELIGEALFRDQPFQDFEVEHDFPYIGRRTMRLNARRISTDNNKRRFALLAIEDITERREEAELRYQRLFETAKDGILLFDAETERLNDVNPYFLEMSGYSRERLIGLRIADMQLFRAADGTASTIAEARSREIVRRDGVPLFRIDGKRLEVEFIANLYSVGGQSVVQVNIRDVTVRNLAVQALRESEERFRLLVDSVRDYALFQLDLRGQITSWNPGAERLLGYRESEIVGRPADSVFTPEDLALGEPARELETARLRGKAENERWHIRKDGTRFFAATVLTTVQDEVGRLRGFAKVMRDITEQRTAEDQIRASLQEKEVLLKEIHHRVKNNLQVIVSLLSLQSEYLAGSGVLTTLEDMKNRVRSIAAIHEMLYGSADLSRVDFAAYLDSIAQDLASFYAESAHRIRLLVNSENISLDITQAVPCGLIVNEILTNSFKHAFPNNRSGSIEVAFRCVNEECILEIADNGIGLPENVEPQKSSSMGLQLLALLVRQLRGRLETHRDSGARFVITFRQKPTEPQP